MTTRWWFVPILLAVQVGCGRGCACGNAAQPQAPAVDRSNGVLPQLQAVRVPPGTFHINGIMDEDAWQRCGSTHALVGPSTGRPEPASQVQARARVCWDERALYVGMVVEDPDPLSPFGRQDVDPHLWEQASAVEIMLQPGDPGDNRTYVEVQVDIHGAVWDTWFDDYNQPVGAGPDGARRYGHQEWSANVERMVTVEPAERRYVVEIALPWASLPPARTAVPPAAGDTWRLNVYSFKNGQRDALAWSPILGQGNFHRAARFGRLTFAGP